MNTAFRNIVKSLELNRRFAEAGHHGCVLTGYAEGDVAMVADPVNADGQRVKYPGDYIAPAGIAPVGFDTVEEASEAQIRDACELAFAELLRNADNFGTRPIDGELACDGDLA